jgi:hypothetical protein
MRKIPEINRWVTSGKAPMSGRNFIGAIHIRLNSLSTRLRAARSAPDSDALCEICCRPESLGYILQICERTWALWNHRHDKVCEQVSKRLTKKGFTVVQEPRISTWMGIRVPDIVAHRNGLAYVIDVTIVSDDAKLSNEYDHKVRYYDCVEIRQWVSQSMEVEMDGISCVAVAFNWRGALARKSAKVLKEMQFSHKEMELLDDMMTCCHQSSHPSHKSHILKKCPILSHN